MDSTLFLQHTVELEQALAEVQVSYGTATASVAREAATTRPAKPLALVRIPPGLLLQELIDFI